MGMSGWRERPWRSVALVVAVGLGIYVFYLQRQLGVAGDRIDQLRDSSANSERTFAAEVDRLKVERDALRRKVTDLTSRLARERAVTSGFTEPRLCAPCPSDGEGEGLVSPRPVPLNRYDGTGDAGP